MSGADPMNGPALSEDAPAVEGPTGRRTPSLPVLILVGLFLAIGLGSLALRLGPGGVLTASEIDLSIPDWRPSSLERAALAQVARARLDADPGGGPRTRTMVEAYEAFNRADLRYASSPRSSALSDAKAEYEQRALAAFSFLGAEAYMALGARIVRDYLMALDLGDTPTLDRLGGTFLTQARLTGLIGGERALQPGAEVMIPIVLMARWAYAVSARARPDTLLSHEEATLLLRWKLSANPLVPPGRRSQIADQLLRMKDTFEVQRCLAARAADEGDWRSAATLYEALAKARPHDRSAQATALYARRQASP